MNIAQSGYHMLMILSVADGQYSIPEGKIIINFLKKNYELDFDIDTENQALLELTKENLPSHFKKEALNFLEHSTAEQRLDFIAFAYKLINADGQTEPQENKIFNSLAHFWHIDLGPVSDQSIANQNQNS